MSLCVMGDAVIGEKGLERHLGEEVTIRKEGIDYFGLLEVDEGGVYFVYPNLVRLGSRDFEESRGEVLDVARLNRTEEDRIIFKRKARSFKSGERVDRYRMFVYVGEA
jgi:hypothetical protein